MEAQHDWHKEERPKNRGDKCWQSDTSISGERPISTPMWKPQPVTCLGQGAEPVTSRKTRPRGSLCAYLPGPDISTSRSTAWPPS